MIEFFQNCWNAIVQHKDAIIAFITSAEFATLVVMLINLVRNGKNTSANTVSNVELNKTLTKELHEMQTINSKLSAKIDNIDYNNTQLLGSINKAHELSNETCEKVTLLLTKLDAILEVQFLAYSTIKDVEIRKSIMSILTNAKHTETLQMSELKQELEKLKTQIVQQTENVKTVVEDTVKKAETIIHVADETNMDSVEISKKHIVRS